MRLTHLSTVSALAFVLALGAPAIAQQTTEETADQTTDQTTGEQTTGQQTTEIPGGADAPGDVETGDLTVAELHGLMTEIGMDDAEVFGGDAIVARTEQGHPAIMLIGPQNFEPGEVDTLGVGTLRDFREQMTEAGFQDVTEARGWQPVQGTLDGHLVFAADPVLDTGTPIAGLDAPNGDDAAQAGADAGTGETAEFGIGEATGEFDPAQFGEVIGQTGIEEPGEVQGRLVRAQSDGQSFMLFIGPEGFAAGEQVQLGDDALRGRFEGAGLSDVQFVDDRFAMHRGSYNDMAVLIIGGPGLAE